MLPDRLTKLQNFMPQSGYKYYFCICIMNKVYLALGTNIGNRQNNLQCATELIAKNIGNILLVSGYLQSKPFGFQSENDFLNAVMVVETDLTPSRLLAQTQELERQMGRTKKSVNGTYADRIIDIDILLYDNLIIDTPDLKIPHPSMTERDFVLIPLLEIAPDVIHPLSGKPMAHYR